MATPQENKLIVWLRNQVLVQRSAGPLVRLEVRHLAGGKMGNEVITIDVPVGEEPGDDWFNSVAAQVVTTAESDAQAITGMQTYSVLAYRQKEPRRANGRHVIRVDGGTDDEGISGYESEPATEKGLQRQLMRHLEAKERTTAAMMASFVASSQRIISNLAEQNEALQAQRFKSLDLVEDLMSKQAERDLLIAEQQHKERLTEELMGEVKLLVPAVMKRLTSSNSPEEHAAGSELDNVVPAQTLAIKRFLESLDEEQRAAMLKNLKPAQQIALMELLQSA